MPRTRRGVITLLLSLLIAGTGARGEVAVERAGKQLAVSGSHTTVGETLARIGDVLRIPVTSHAGPLDTSTSFDLHADPEVVLARVLRGHNHILKYDEHGNLTSVIVLGEYVGIGMGGADTAHDSQRATPTAARALREMTSYDQLVRTSMAGFSEQDARDGASHRPHTSANGLPRGVPQDLEANRRVAHDQVTSLAAQIKRNDGIALELLRARTPQMVRPATP